MRPLESLIRLLARMAGGAVVACWLATSAMASDDYERPERDLWDFIRMLFGRFSRTFAVTLPEIGEERAYGIPFQLSNAAMETFDACGCAMRNPELAIKGHLDCRPKR